MPEETQFQASEEQAKGKINPIAILSYIGILFLIPLLFEKKDEFVKFHVKQGITLFIAVVITYLFWIIPVIGWLIGFIGGIFWFVLAILGIVNVLKGEKKPLPVIGKFAENWKI